jgi:hypothetical protein
MDARDVAQREDRALDPRRDTAEIGLQLLR